MSSQLTHADILSLPKIDLHRHLDGAIRPELVLQLAKELGLKLPTDDLDEFTKLYQITEPKNMPIKELFQRFAWAIAVTRTPRGLYQAACKQVYDLRRENIWYAEIRFAPGYHSIYPATWYSFGDHEKGLFRMMSLEETVKSVLGGLQLGMKDTGVTVNLILCIPRESMAIWGPINAMEVVELALKYQSGGVVGIDLACDEYTYPPDPYISAFRSTIDSNIRRTIHAGEMGSQWDRLQNITTCIEKFNPNGLGHAIPIYLSEYLMDLVRYKNIRIERTPLSPVPGCSLTDGRLDILLKEKVPVVITSDDPVLMQASLTDNWEAALNFYGYGEKEFWQLTDNALNTAFYRDEAEKKRIWQLFTRQRLER